MINLKIAEGGRSRPGQRQSAFYGCVTNFPYCRKWSSKAKAVLTCRRSISAKLVQSVKLNS